MFIEDLAAGKIDVVAFTSPSTVKSLASNARQFHLEDEIKDRLRRVIIASIGPTTRKVLEDLGFQVQVMPEQYTVEALAEEIARYFQKKDEQTGTESLDDIDRQILQMLQYDFPLVVRPWSHIAKKLGVDSQTVMSRVKRLIDLRVIRKIGPFPDLRRIGFKSSTLIGVRVPEEKIEEVAKVINGLGSVSHNYLREHRYNLWFTVTAKDKQEIQEILKLLRKIGLQDQDILNLPTVQTFKTDVRFTLP
jgi:DNA-binding Lrp family transcriptional regulator